MRPGAGADGPAGPSPRSTSTRRSDGTWALIEDATSASLRSRTISQVMKTFA